MGELDVVGQWPELAGRRCEAVLVEQYWHEGEPCEPANVVWLEVATTWHRLVIDCGVVFWRKCETGPAPYEMPELRAEVRLLDIGAEACLAGRLIDDVVGSTITGGAEVRIGFRFGPTLVLRNVDDHTVYSIG